MQCARSAVGRAIQQKGMTMALEVEYVKPESLRPAAINPRRIDDRALSALSRLLDEHGFVVPVVARREDRLLIGGHQRIKANSFRKKPAKLVPCVFLEGISDERAKALTVSLNNPAAQGYFDVGLLGELLAGMDASDLDLPATTGLPEAEIADLTAALAACEPDTLEPDDLLPLRDEDEAEGNEVVVILEMPPESYQLVRSRLDRLISDYGLTCHVRMGG